jgi:hemolysin III
MSSGADVLVRLRGRRSRRPGQPGRRSGCWTGDEEWANGLSHAAGCLLFLPAGGLLIAHTRRLGPPWQVATSLVFVLSLCGVYLASTLSHWVRSTGWRDRFRIWDQGLIYLLIAGSYTPFATRYVPEWQWLTLLVWILAVAGFLSKVGFAHRVDGIALWLYLGLGWLPLSAILQLVRVAPAAVSTLVIAGGLAYTLGTWFLMNDHRATYLHVVWHALVIAGSTCHFLAVWASVG